MELGIAVALAVVLAQVRLFRLPQGGSVTAGSMVPLFYVSLRWGAIAGGVAGVLHSLIGPFIVHPIQYLLDYPIAYAAIGLAGFFQGRPVVGVIIGGAGRWFSHFLSGIVFFASYAPKG